MQEHDREQFASAMQGYGAGMLSAEAVVNCLGPARRAETGALAREELRRILIRQENLDDLLGLNSGVLWTMEEEKIFEYGLFLYDPSTHDRFGMISSLMCGSRARDECKKRYMKLMMDMCQIELGVKSVQVAYQASPPPLLPSPSGGRPGQVWMM